MLPRKRRLSKELIEKVSKQGKTVRGCNIFLKHSIISGNQSGFAFIVPSKTARKAVFRNKLKRRGRTVVSKLLPKIKDGCQALIFFEKGSAEMKFSEIEREITRLFQKADLFF